MNFPWPGGFLFLLREFQEPPVDPLLLQEWADAIKIKHNAIKDEFLMYELGVTRKKANHRKKQLLIGSKKR